MRASETSSCLALVAALEDLARVVIVHRRALRCAKIRADTSGGNRGAMSGHDADTATDRDTVTAMTMTAAEAAQLAGVSPRTIRRWIKNGWLASNDGLNGHEVYPADLPEAAQRARQGRVRDRRLVTVVAVMAASLPGAPRGGGKVGGPNLVPVWPVIAGQPPVLNPAADRAWRHPGQLRRLIGGHGYGRGRVPVRGRVRVVAAHRPLLPSLVSVISSHN